MNIELVVFDLAGTTVKDNFDVHRVLQRALARFDVLISIEDANAVMGIPKPVAIRSLLEKQMSEDHAITESFVMNIHQVFVSEMIRFYEKDSSVGEKEGVSATFAALRRNGIKVGVDTGFDRPIVTPLLDRLGWMKNGLIDCSVTSDEVPRGRPYPDMIFKAMEITGVKEASRIAKVGDTASDLEEGMSAGCGLVVGITTGAFSRAELNERKHTHLIDHVSEILDILKIS